MTSTVAQICSDIKTAIDKKDELRVAFIASEYSSPSRLKIAQSYEATYKTPITEAIKKSIKGGSVEDLLVNMWVSRHEHRAELINKAISGSNDEEAIRELVFLCNPEDWHETASIYNQKYQKIMQDAITKAIGNKSHWAKLVTGWMEHKREGRGSVDNDVKYLKELIDAPVTDGDALARFFSSTTPDEYTQIADKFCEEYNLSIDQALVRPLKENENDLDAYAAAHFVLHGLPVLAAQLINKACRPKNGNERSICRITTLVVDQCLAAKYAYKLYGDMGADLSRCFDDRMAPILRTLWRVTDA